jgi:Arc/MetJ-type ribon-helix-helix transcriptional regulator
MSQNNNENGQVHWNIQVDKSMSKAVDHEVEHGWYRTRAEFIRSIVREKLSTIESLHHTKAKNGGVNE